MYFGENVSYIFILLGRNIHEGTVQEIKKKKKNSRDHPLTPLLYLASFKYGLQGMSRGQGSVVNASLSN